MSEPNLKNACMNGNIDMVRDIIKYPERYNTYYSWNFGLYKACESGHLDIVKLMIKCGANNYDSGLIIACENGYLNIVDLMIEYGADDWNRALEGACRGGNLDIIKLLIELGANDWNEGLRYACEGGHLDVAKLMIRHGANYLNPVVHLISNMIDSDIINLIIERKMRVGIYLTYPEDKIKIFKLHKLGVSSDIFREVHGSNDLKRDIKQRQNIIRHILFGHLIRDMVNIVTGYVIN